MIIPMFFFSSRRRHTIWTGDWSSDVCSSDLVYITRRLGEVREIAVRVTVLRDGAIRGTSPVEEISDDELLALIICRTRSEERRVGREWSSGWWCRESQG